jgi:aspartate oxidase
MTKYVGPVRTQAGLKRAKAQIGSIVKEAESFTLCDKYEFELYNMGQVATMVIDGALARKESVGAHYLADEAHSGSN